MCGSSEQLDGQFSALRGLGILSIVHIFRHWGFGIMVMTLILGVGDFACISVREG